MRRLVENENACALPGCTIKYDSFMTCLRRAVSRGYVHVRHAEFVEHGLTHGFDCGVQRELLFGKRVFSNYKSAEEARSSVTKAIQSRLKKGKSLALGAWSVVESALRAAGVEQYFVFPMGAVAKKDSPDPTNPIMRPTDDHTKTGLNKATCMDMLRYALKTYAEAVPNPHSAGMSRVRFSEAGVRFSEKLVARGTRRVPSFLARVRKSG